MTTTAEMVATDYQFDERYQTVTYTPKTGTPLPTVQARRADLSFREAMPGGPAGIKADDCVWIIAAATIGVTPARTATITTATGEVWTIQNVTVFEFGGTPIEYRCICRKQA